ncbi:hypothetical protein ACV3V4_16385, partial [Clostridium perfringens]
LDKKKLIIGGSILVILIIGGTIFSLNKLKNNKQEPIKVEENKKDNKILEKSNEELKKKYYLLQNSNISVKDRVEASEVARKFAKDMTEFDINNPKKNEEEALSLVSTDIDKEVEGYFITLGQSKEIKEKKVTKIRSEERNNKDNNGYVYIYVTVVYDNIDENNQKKQDSKSYKMQLLKIDNEYKITSYKEY